MIQGHDAVLQRFRRAAARGRLAGSFLFVGPSGIGKRHFAFALAKGVLCKDTSPDAPLDPCGRCESCRLFGEDGQALTEIAHPDLYFVSKPPEKSLLPLELLIGDKEHRGRAGLCYDISRTPFLGHRKVAIVDDADFFSEEGANALLKTLEEPPPDSVLILIGTSSAKQLPTIRSRCKIIRFAPLPARVLASILVEQDVVSTLEQGLALARRADGSIDLAKELVDDAVEDMRTELLKHLGARSPDAVGFAARLNELVEQAGKEAPLRRRRLRLLFSLAVDFLRDKMKKNESPRSPETVAAHERHQIDAQLAARRLARTLDALEQIDRNANLPYVIEAWCYDL